MNQYDPRLVIDLGAIGYSDEKEPFRVELEAAELCHLIEHAKQAHRVYELMLIDRPGDLWQYIDVVPQSLPTKVTENIRYHLAREKSPDGDAPQWSELRMPYTKFCSFFGWYGDDTEPAAEAWLADSNQRVIHAYARQLLTIIREAREALRWEGGLIRHEIDRYRDGTHDFHLLARDAAIHVSRRLPPAPRAHTPEFYAMLADLLREKNIKSVSYRGDGDYEVMKCMASEQISRANKSGSDPEDGLAINALLNRGVNETAWGAAIRYFDEGFRVGELHVECGRMGGLDIKSLLESRRMSAMHYLLSSTDEGDIPGFARTAGEGWFRYDRIDIQSR
jgi:hypothetical protein